MATNPAAWKNKGEYAADFPSLYNDLSGGKQGWLNYHLGQLLPFGQHLLAALVDREERVPQLGYRFVKELHVVKYVSVVVDPAAWKARF